MKLFEELKRRNVFRVAGVYAVVGWLLTQVSSALENALSLPGWFDAVIVSALLIGFPIALILAWAFELTPEGVKLTATVAEGESIAQKTGRQLDYAILGGVALVAAMFVVDRVTPGPASFETAASQPPQDAGGADAQALSRPEEASAPGGGAVATDAPAASIAVLAFADLSPAGDQAYFSEGIAEEILNVLAKVDGLSVAARTSSFAFKGRETLGIPAIADELGVRHVLEGSVRKSGAAIRVTAQLIDSKSNAHLWSETFDRQLTAENVFALQDEIAAAIVGALRDKLSLKVGDAAPVAVQTSNVDAYALYLKGRALFQSRRELGAADGLLAEAIEIDPAFADAYAFRAAIHEFGGEYGADLGDEEDARVRGRAFAAKALELNEKSSLAHAIVALQQFDDLNVGRRTSDFETVIAGYERALELDPKNANALNWQGLVYTYVGDNQRAAASHRRCIEVDPALAACRSNLAIELISLGRLDEASAVVDAALDAGAFAQGPGQIILFAELKRPDAFKLMAISLPALRGLRKFDSLYDAMTDPGDDKALAAEIKTLLAANKASARIGVLLNALGDFEEPPLIIAHWGAVMRAYRRSPAFKAHSRASGVDAYWRRHGFPPQCKPVGPQTADSGDFECE